MMRSIVLGALVLLASAQAYSQQLLEGDQKLACEAVLCLASGQRPDQCQPAINRYFSIRARRPGDTIRNRKNFLDMCPNSDSGQNSAIANGAGQCDAATLNATLIVDNGGSSESPSFAVSNRMPDHCVRYQGLGSVQLPIYVGIYGVDGQWVDR